MQIPANLQIQENTTQTLIFHELQSAEIHAKRDSNTVIVAFLTAEPSAPVTLNFHLEESGASITFLAFIIGTKAQNYQIKTISKHTTPNTNAYYYIRSALFDEAKIDYFGNLVIDKIAQQTDCYLAHNSLMLSPKAHTDTEPCLEIEANDVTAGHSATVGRTDESLLFYLMSRGLDRRQAEELLIQGFMQADLDKISDPEVREKLAQEIEQQLQCLT